MLGFPRSILNEVDIELRSRFADWSSDPVLDDRGEVLAHKYIGICRNVNARIKAEYQVVPMLIGLYWDVEHSAIYKPAPAMKTLRDKAASEPLEVLNAKVVRSLLNFEAEFELFVHD
jgi:hypothetical protein